MAIFATTPAAPPQAPATTGAATVNATQSQAAGGPNSFQTVLAATNNPSVQATAAAATAATDLANATTDRTTDNTTDTTATQTTNAELTGLLGLAAQVLGLPANAAVAQATGQTAETTATAQSSDVAARSRIDQLRLLRTGGFISATLANRFLAPATAPTTNALPPTTPANAPTDTNPANAAIPIPTLTPADTAAQAASVVATHGGTSSVIAQAPIVTNLIPIVPVPPDPSVTNPPVAATPAPTPAPALPPAQLGDRPAMTGDRFAALAEAGAMLAAPSGPPGSVVFANTLDQAVSVLSDAGTAGTVLPLVNISSQATAAVVLPPLPMERTAENRSTDASAQAGAINPQAPLSALNQLASPAAVQAASATPAVQVADAVVAHAHVLERDGSTEFHMRLDPPNLGRVDIQLVTRGDEVHGQVLVASDAVRQMIESQLPELRQRLEAAGVNVQQFNVSTDPGSGGNQNAYRPATPEEFAPRTAAPAAASAPRARIGHVDAGSLDVTV